MQILPNATFGPFWFALLMVVLCGCAERAPLKKAPNHVFIECARADASAEAAKQIRRRGYVPVQAREFASLILTVEITSGAGFSCAQIETDSLPHGMSAAMKLASMDGRVKWTSYASRWERSEEAAVVGAVRDAARAPTRGLWDLFLLPLEGMLRVKRAVELPRYALIESPSLPAIFDTRGCIASVRPAPNASSDARRHRS